MNEFLNTVGPHYASAVDATIIDRFEFAAARWPEATALVFEGAQVDYRTLDKRANQLAWELIALGIGPEDIVALRLPRGIDMIVGILGVLKAGGAYLPLDAAVPDMRVSLMLADAAPKVMVTITALALPFNGPVISLDTFAADLRLRPRRAPTDADRLQPLRRAHPAYVIYTSGSTGRPKAVVVTHGQAVRLFSAAHAVCVCGPGDAWTLFHSYAFDFSVWEIWGALFHGARVVIVPAVVARSAEALHALLADEQVTHFNTTPSVFYRLIEADAVAPPAQKLTLRKVIFGGDALQIGRLAGWWARHPDDMPRLINMYGITETTVHVTQVSLGSDMVSGSEAGTIGTPLPDLDVHVLDDRLQPCPVNVVGELYVSGEGLARGYLQRPGLTASRFIAHPFGVNGQRIYRTGDLAAWSAGGGLTFHGRADEQVKIRGHRIEPGEIEAALVDLPEIAQAAVVPRNDARGEIRLIAYVTCTVGQLDIVPLRQQLAQSLPDYMLPAAFVELPTLPLTINGKLDRTALPDPNVDATYGHDLAGTPEETLICSEVAAILGLSHVGPGDNFFEIGGHSLSATQVIARLAVRLGRFLPIQAVFDHPVLHDLARALRDAPRTGPRLTRQFHPDPVPASFAQARLWLVDQIETNPAAYVIPIAMRLIGALDVGALGAAINDVITRHESLRTVLSDATGELCQIVLPIDQARILLSLEACAEVDIVARLAAMFARPFNLETELPVRASLLHVRDADHVLAIALHHCAADGWSLSPLFKDLAEAYAARRPGKKPKFVALPVQYTDYTLWQLRTPWEQDKRLAEHLDYWTRALADLPDEIRLPWDRPRSAVITNTSARIDFCIPSALHADLLALSRSAGATLFMTLHAAIATLLHGFGAGTDIPLGVPVAGRADVALEGLVGSFVNTLVLRLDLGGDPGFAELLARARRVCLDAYAHQDAPFERLVEILSPERVDARHPLFQTMLALHNQNQVPLRLDDIEITPILLPPQPAKFDLSFSFVEQWNDRVPAGLQGSLEYRIELFKTATAHRICTRLVTLLRQVTALSDVPLTQLHADGDEQCRYAPAASPGSDQLLLDLFADRKQSDPALIGSSYALTWGELEVRTNRIARMLIGAGLGPEDVVAVALPRSRHWVEAVLGVLKAGAAFLPLDITAPPARLAALMADGGAKAVLSDAANAAVSDTPTRLVFDDAALGTWSASPITDLDRTKPLHPGHPAYLLFTSGSTGKPKGVVITHQSIAAYVAVLRDVLGVHAMRMPLFTSTVFDLTLTSLFVPLAAGGAIQVFDEDAPDAALTRVFAPESEAAAVKLTPTHAALLEALPFARSRSLRLAVIGGEALTSAHVRTLQARAPDLAILNEYGPTEATIGAVAGTASVDDVSIGKPYPGVEALVLDERLRPCGIGVVGELYLGGWGLARGYARAPARTAERFIAHPYVSGARLYRTGDRAAWRADGALSYHGRTDDQIKLRGLRIEPGQIEAALTTLPKIAQAVVVLTTERNEPRLAAYVAPTAGVSPEALDPLEVRAALGDILPAGMLPDVIVILPTLPITANGKINRRALPALDSVSARYLPPRTAAEQLLCAVLTDLLGGRRVGRDDHFFRIGGHSLLAARLAAQIRQRSGVVLPIRTIFQNPVISGLADALTELSPISAELPRADPDNTHEPFPLTDTQQAYWLGRQGLVSLGGVACHAYNEYAIQDLDIERLAFAWNAAVERHPMLRAIVDAEGNQRVLKTLPPVTIGIGDYRKLGSDELSHALLKVRDSMSHQLLPADRGPLFDIRASRITDETWRLHVSIDALILDGESTARLLDEVFSVYAGKWTPRPSGDITFRDHVLHQAALTPRRREAEAYWRARLETIPPAPALPLAMVPSRMSDQRFRRWHARLPADLWSALKVRAANADLTPSAVLLAAYAEVIAGWTRSESFTLNITVGDRQSMHPHSAEMLGVFTTLTPLAIVRTRTGTFRDRARDQQAQLAADLDQRAFGGVEAQRLIAQREGDPEAGLLPVVFTSLLGEATFQPEQHGLEQVYAITQTPQTWLDNKVYEHGTANAELLVDWDAPAALFPAGLLDVMLEAFLELLRQLAREDAAWTEPDRSLLPIGERALFETTNDTSGPLPDDLLHDPVFAAMQSYPDRIAVRAGTGEISFAELALMTQRLARQLDMLPGPRDELVAVIMEKGAEQIIAVLAILAAGRAFLPISAGQPDQRITTILEKAGVRAAITQSHLRRDRMWRDKVDVLEIDLASDHEPASSWTAAHRAMPEDLAYVIYTSGSTGQPKGVAISHRSARNTLADMADRFALLPDDAVLWVSSLEFDLSIFDIFAVLGSGGCVVVPPPDANRSPGVLREALATQGVTIWNSAPAIAELMLSTLPDTDEACLPDLRLVLLSGDWITVTLPGRLKRLAPGARIVSLGGATEASIWSIFHAIEHVDPAWPSIPYGKPLRNQAFHVLRDDLSGCPVHVAGKLYISGAGLALRYWNDPEQTDARFIRRPADGMRLYDTGDLGRYHPDGTIEFLGREDQQIKLRGFRVELGEIEAALMSHPKVHTAAVAPHRTDGQVTLVGYVIPRDHDSALAADVSIRDPVQRAAFTLRQHGRPLQTGPVLRLPGSAFSEARTNAFIARQSYRRFEGGALTLAKLGDWLGAAQTMPMEGALLPKRRYASAGGLYPVRLYLLVKADAVEGLDSGAYVYDPFDHALVQVGAAGFDSSVVDRSNLAIAESASLAIVLVSHLPAILPLYGEWGKAACLIEAGALAHALAEHGLAQGIGSCAVGGADDVALRSVLGLADAATDSLLHVLLAGAVTDEQQSRVSPLTFDTEAAVTRNELREWLLARLPDYMVPATFVTIHALPLTPNGKLDRKSLPAPYGPADDNEYVPPATPDEVLLCDLVADLLDHKRVGLHDNFFHLGGHSLSAARLAARVRARVGRELSIQSIFERPKLGTLASLLREAPKIGPRLAARRTSDHPPLSFAQTRLWFLNRLDPTGAQYNIPIAMRIKGRLDRIALESALNDVVARHESLRTLMVEGDDGPRQRILPPAADRIRLDTRQSATPSCDSALKDLAAQGFDLSRAIPLRATLLNLDDDTSVLLIVIHHSAADAWSMAPLLNDLAQAYAARRANSRFSFQALPIQYADFALWQRDQFDQDGIPGDRLTDQIRYWRETLSDLPVEPGLPYDRPRPPAPASAGGTVPIEISATLLERLRAIAQTNGVTLFMVLQAGITTLLAKLGGGSKIPIGTPISGRDDVVLEEVVGFFVNTLVLCTDVSGDPSFEKLLERARTVCLDAYAHKDVPFERLVEILDPPRTIGRQPLFQTMVAFNARSNLRPELAGVTTSLIPVRVDAAKFDLSFDFTESEDGLESALEYNAALFNHATAETIASRC